MESLFLKFREVIKFFAEILLELVYPTNEKIREKRDKRK